MSTGQNVQTVKDFFAAAFGGDREAMPALVTETSLSSPRELVAQGARLPEAVLKLTDR